MRILLIHSNSFNFGQLPREIESERGLNPPISLAYIAATAKKANHDVKILDMDAEKIDIHHLNKYIKNFNPKVIGFNVLTNNLKEILAISKIIKIENPNIMIIYGGVQLNLYPELTIKYPYVDFGVIGEGEETFPELLDSLEKKKNLESVKGIIYKKNNKIIKTPPREPIPDLNLIPFPARELLLNNKYYSLISQRSPVTIAITSRGCPYNCSFCYRPNYWHKIRYVSPQYVINEFKECSDLGIKEIMIYDDNFSLNRERTIEICKKLINEKLDLTWDIRTRIDQIDEELLRWLWKAGCKRICYGVESGDPDVLKTYNKKITIPKIKEVFQMTRKFGFDILAYFMIGAPGETKETINNTFKTMISLDPDYIHLTHLIPYPDTSLFNYGVKNGIFKEDIWTKLSSLDYNTFPMFTNGELTREDIFDYVKMGYHKFYYRPNYILQRFRKISNFKSLWRTFKAAISI